MSCSKRNSRMSQVDFITFCYPGDINRLYAGSWFQGMIDSHQCWFDNIWLIQQRCRGIPIHLLDIDFPVKFIESEDHPDILAEFNLPELDERAEHYTHGPNAPHYWKWHVINHLIGLKVSSADYIVFSDADCTIRSQSTECNWIKTGIDILERYPKVLIVGPGDGAVMCEALTKEGYRLTQNVSQQVFLCNRERLKSIGFNVPWDWEFLAPGGPFQEFYYLLEGRIWRYMNQHSLWRCILPDEIARYWHHNKLTDEGMFETDYSKW